MKIHEDRSHMNIDTRWFEKGYAKEDVHSLRLQSLCTEAEATANKQFYDSLPPEYQKAVDEAAIYARDAQRADINGKEAKMLADMKAKGMEVDEVDIDSFKEATKDLYREPAVAKLVKPELVELVKKAIADMPKS